jgi:ADP-ribosylglycohydrolase
MSIESRLRAEIAVFERRVNRSTSRGRPAAGQWRPPSARRTRGLRSLLALAAVLAVVVAARAASPRPESRPLSDAEYYDKVRGAWLGKCVGGALGMPLESWRYPDIDRKYPSITGYVGYFTDTWTGWSGINDVVTIPRDDQWHRLSITVRVPDCPASAYAVPIVGMSYERSTVPATFEIRGLRIVRPRTDIRFDASEWQPGDACSWAVPGTARFEFIGKRAWIRLAPDRARQLGLKPGDPLTLTLEAKWVSGDNTVGVAFDYRSRAKRTGFGPDDDTTYQIIGLHALETYGPDVTSVQIAAEWVQHLPAISTSLAEGLALERLKQGIMPPQSGEHPIGEAIGGQMKGEIWGLICPGRPDLAAEYARRDGVVAHCRNGVYGEQFVAAMIAAAFDEKDARKLIRIGLSQIPADSKYASVVREVIAWHDRYPDWRDTRRVLLDKYPDICNPVYGEAGIVVLALLYGGGDFEKSICIAASCGNDTDCNTATVGALLGCIHGAHAIPAKWTGPIDDQFRCFARGLEAWRISELAHRICTAGRRAVGVGFAPSP